MMSNLDFMPSLLASLGFAQGYRDVVGIIENQAIYNIGTSVPLETIQPHLLIPMDSFSFAYNQEVNTMHLGGGGLEPNTFHNNQMGIRLNSTFPLMAHVSGMVDPVFSKLWQLTYYASWGSPTYVVAGVSGNAGDVTMLTDNVADFLQVAPLNLLAYIDDGAASEYVTINAATKASRVIGINSPLAYSHNMNTAILYLRVPSSAYYNDPTKDPTFALTSVLGGYMTPCMVNKIHITSKPEDVVKVEVEFVIGNVYGDKVKQITDVYNQLVYDRAQLPPYRMVYGNAINISEFNTVTGEFGLPIFTDMPYTGGFLGLQIYNNTIASIDITIENNLKEVYTLWSARKNNLRHADNMMPFGYYSGGRKIYGDIVFRNPVASLAFTQKIAGPSSVNTLPLSTNHGSLLFDFKCFTISIPELVWEPGSFSNNNTDIDRSLKWQMVSKSIDTSLMPEPGYSYIS